MLSGWSPSASVRHAAADEIGPNRHVKPGTECDDRETVSECAIDHVGGMDHVARALE